MNATCKRLTIFEGPDGAGKTTAAKKFAEHTGAEYVHFPSLPMIHSGLARVYVEAMLPALLGHRDVVFDRSWLSELPYGTVFREGSSRLSKPSIRMLERLALRCSTSLIMCLPNIGVCTENFKGRSGEMLKNGFQLHEVHDIYKKSKTDLPVVLYDYTCDGDICELVMLRSTSHNLEIRSAGNIRAGIILVGDEFGKHKNEDPFYQWPFASFSKIGCSQWFTAKLQEADISEQDLLWVNSNEPNLTSQFFNPSKLVIAMGLQASTRLKELGVNHINSNHPQHQKRFNPGGEYRMIKQIKEVLDGR